MEKKYVCELIYNLLEKGYTKEVILFYITSTVDTNLDIDTIHRLYKLTKIKWLKAKYNNYDNIKPVLSEKDKLQQLTEEITELKAIYEQYIRR